MPLNKVLKHYGKGNSRRRHKIKFAFPPGGGENNGSLVPARNNNQVYRNQVAGTVEEIELPLKKKVFLRQAVFRFLLLKCFKTQGGELSKKMQQVPRLFVFKPQGVNHIVHK